MWYFLQGVVMFGVLASNIHFHWTPNHYLAALIAAAARTKGLNCFGQHAYVRPRHQCAAM